VPTRVLLYTLQDEKATSECEGLMGCCEGDTFEDLRVRLEVVQVVEWPFQFWDSAGQCRVKVKMERLNPVGNEVHVIKCTHAGLENGKRIFREAFGDAIVDDVRVEVVDG
jgi:hypothetical protein